VRSSGLQSRDVAESATVNRRHQAREILQVVAANLFLRRRAARRVADLSHDVHSAPDQLTG
jgi:hypothetical protein